MGEMTMVGVLTIPALVLSLSVIVWMVVSLAREKDERGEMILAKAGQHTLIILVAVLVICAVRNLAEIARSDWQLDPFVLLTGIAVCFAAELFYWKLRYGG